MANNNEGKWIWDTSDEVFRPSDYFNTKEEAIEDAKAQEDEGEVVYVGQVTDPITSVNIDVDNILEMISDQMYEEVGEAAEGYLDRVEQAAFTELESRLNDTLMEWMEEFNYKPDFFKVGNIEGVKL